jgi:O-antigen/teichoic acid export membrane protein
MWIKLIKTNFTYAIGSTANSAAQFLLIPFLVNAFSAAEYGAWAIIEIMVMFVNMIILAGMDIGLMREYWYLDDEEERRRLAGTVISAVGLLGLALTLVLSFPLFSWGNLPLLPRTWQDNFTSSTLWLALAISLVEAIFMILQAIYRIRELANIFAFLSFSKLVMFMGAAIVGVELGGGLNGALLGRLIAAITCVIISAFLGTRYIRLSLDWPRLKSVLHYGMPLLPAGVASYILFASDRFVLQSFYTLEIVAIYTFAYKIATALDILVTRPFATDWAARRFKIATEANPQRKYAAVLMLYLFVAAGIALVIIAFTPLAYSRIAPSNYQASAGVVPIILAAYLIYGLSYPLNIGIMLKDRTLYLAITNWVAAIVCLALNFFLIPRYSMAGAAWATLLAYLVWTTGITIISLRLYPVHYSGQILLSILFACAAGYGGIWLVDLGMKSSLPLAALYKFSWILVIFSSTGYHLWHRRHAWLLPAPEARIPGDSTL